MRVSIIIPIFNAQEYLNKSVNSVLLQKHKDIEVILVDDGSSDKSGVICDDFARRDGRIKVIHQKNAGVSKARNAGIDAATGDYIGFVDSDDWIVPDMYERLCLEAKKARADVVMCDATTVYCDNQTHVDTISQLSSNTVLKKKDFQPSLLVEMAGSACRCIYSDKLIKTSNLHFPLGIKFSEDRVFNLYAFGYANAVAYVKEAFYKRFMNFESAVHRFHIDYFKACKLAANETAKAIKLVWSDNEELQQAYLKKFIASAEMAICNYYYRTSPLSPRERYYALQELCEDSQLRCAIKRCGFGWKSWCILHKQIHLLGLYARLANYKHGR